MGDFETLTHKTTQNLKSKITARPMPPKTPRPNTCPARTQPAYDAHRKRSRGRART